MGPVGQFVGGRHEYRLRAGQRAVDLILALACGVLAVFIFAVSRGALPGAVHPAGGMVISASFAALALYITLSALRSRLVIDGTRMRIQGAVRTWEFDLSQVEGYRTEWDRSGSFRVICLKDGAATIRLAKYAADKKLEEWLAGLKDLDAASSIR